MANDTSITDVSAEAGVRYLYRVEGMNACGTGGAAADSGGRPGLPARITSLTVTNNRCDGILVRWRPAVGASGYTLRRILGTDTFLVAVTPDTFRLDTAAPIVGSQRYTVTSNNRCGSAQASNPASGLRLPLPGVPFNLSATDTLCNQIRVTWRSSGRHH